MRKKRFLVYIVSMFALGTVTIAGSISKMDRQAERTPNYMIHLKEWAFSPVMGEPAVPIHLKATYENRVKLLQVNGPMSSEWIEAREKDGVVFLSFMNDFTYIVYLKDGLEESLAASHEVLWINDFHPAYKIRRELLKETDPITVRILTWPNYKEQNNKEIVKEAINAFGVRNLVDEEYSPLLRASLSTDEIIRLLQMDEVHWIDRYFEPVAMMNNVRIMTGADTAASGGGFDGTGIVGEVKDDGCDTGHQDFDNLIGTYGTVTTESHGTCTFGIVFSTHTGNAKGMIYNADGVFADWNTDRVASIQNLKNTWGGVFQSNSWSEGYMDGDYTSISYDDDNAINTYDVSMLYAAGNSNYGVGSKTITEDSAAKNVICVGAVYHQDTSGKSDDQWENQGWGNTPSQGPAADNRIKPDICGVFDSIYTTDRRGSGGYSSGDYYSDFGGTSGATPICAGGAGIIYQMYEENHFGNNPGGSTPHTATVKALLIANAYQYSLSKATRYQQGWGLADVGQAYNAAADQLIVDGGTPLATGGSTAYNVQRISSSTPMKIVLCWTDKPGETSSSKALINDLDLTVTAPNSTVYYGNAGLTGNLYSTSGGSADRINNVECVFIQSPLAGNYEIVVSAYNVAQDNDPGSGVKQAYSLAVSECNPIAGNQDPELTDPLVTPDAGYYGTLYEYRVKYYDADGDAPGVIQVNIDGGNHAMTLDSGSAANGTYRYRTRDLATGAAHTYYFYAEDGQGGSDRNPDSGTWSGPTNYEPELYLYGTPGAGNWMTVEVWGAVDALWAASWSSQDGPYYLPASGLTYDVGPGDLHMAKKIVDAPVNLDAYGYGAKDFKIPDSTVPGTKYIQATTKMNAYWAKTNYETFIIP